MRVRYPTERLYLVRIAFLLLELSYLSLSTFFPEHSTHTHTNIYKGVFPCKSMINAIWLKRTMVRGVKKDRWECPECAFKFNRDLKKRGQETTCPDCKIKLELDPFGSKQK